MMRTLRISLILALALLIAAPLLAQEEKAKGGRGKRGAGAFGMMGGGMTVQRIQGILDKLTLNDDEKAATKKIMEEDGAKLEKLQKAAAPTTEQQAAIKEAVTKAREDGVAFNEMADIIAKAAKYTDEQAKARKEAGPLAKELLGKIREKLSDDNKAAFDKAARGGAAACARARPRPSRLSCFRSRTPFSGHLSRGGSVGVRSEPR